MITHICPVCNAEFSHRSYSKNIFCSQQCYGASNRVTYTDQHFWDGVDKSDGCWEWTRSVGSHGYGAYWDGKKLWTCHRYVWTITNGEIPGGLHVLHTCDNRTCCNPSHLFLGTNNDNIADRMAKGRSRTTPKAGEQHHSAKLTDATVRKMLKELAKGRRGVQSRLARKYGVSHSVVNRIASGKGWTHIPR